METRQWQGFVRLIRNNMRYYGALRLDHVMSLFRLWWVAAGSSPSEGAYVHYPLQQILAVLALESARAACLVVGEDLGVVPDEMRRAMPEFGVYHYKVLLFEKDGGRFRRPDEFVRRALATVTTHDMPTLRSYWEGRDIELRRRLESVSERGNRARGAMRARSGPSGAARRLARPGPATGDAGVAGRSVHAATRAGDASVPGPLAARCWWRCSSRICWAWSSLSMCRAPTRNIRIGSAS